MLTKNIKKAIAGDLLESGKSIDKRFEMLSTEMSKISSRPGPVESRPLCTYVYS